MNIRCPSDQQKEDRGLARQYGVPIGDAEVLRHQFSKYDADGSGQIDKEEFSCILRELIKAKNPDDIPQERFEHYWREIDTDQSGEVRLRCCIEGGLDVHFTSPFGLSSHGDSRLGAKRSKKIE